jgi:hypothetical protein
MEYLKINNYKSDSLIFKVTKDMPILNGEENGSPEERLNFS